MGEMGCFKVSQQTAGSAYSEHILLYVPIWTYTAMECKEVCILGRQLAIKKEQLSPEGWPSYDELTYCQVNGHRLILTSPFQKYQLFLQVQTNIPDIILKSSTEVDLNLCFNSTFYIVCILTWHPHMTKIWLLQKKQYCQHKTVRHRSIIFCLHNLIFI